MHEEKYIGKQIFKQNRANIEKNRIIGNSVIRLV